MSEPTTKSRKPKFKFTRELMKIAIADGMTQQEIATVCRTQQSVVSGWLRGASLAFEHQVVELRKRYGSRLNRTTARVYLVEHSEPAAAPRIVSVEGPIVFRYTFICPAEDPRKKLPFVRFAVARWIVHRHGRGHFVLVDLLRRQLDEEQRARWQEEVRSTSHAHILPHMEWVDCDDDAGRWLARVTQPLDAAGLIAHCDRHLADPNTTHNVHDELTLPFLLRKMLAEQGQDVDGLVRMLVGE